MIPEAAINPFAPDLTAGVDMAAFIAYAEKPYGDGFPYTEETRIDVSSGGLLSGPGGECDDLIAAVIPCGGAIINAATVRLAGAERLHGTLRELDKRGRPEIADQKETSPLAGEVKPLERVSATGIFEPFDDRRIRARA